MKNESKNDNKIKHNCKELIIKTFFIFYMAQIKRFRVITQELLYTSKHKYLLSLFIIFLYILIKYEKLIVRVQKNK